VTGAVAVAMLAGTSAFAEDRPANETGRQRTRVERNRDTSSSRSQSQQQRSNGEWRRQQPQQQSAQQPSQTFRSNGGTNSYDRSNRTYNRNDNSSRYDSNRNSNRNDNRNWNRNDSRYDHRNDSRYDNRNNNRNYGYNNNRNYNRYDRSRPQYYSGRVSRYERYGSGYRVWIGGAPFPFFIPEVRFRAFPIRVGVSIRLGGYYNPGGYYDYYDAGPVYGAYTNGSLRGVVESVDYRNGTFVIHDDVSGDFVTALMRSRDRLMDDLRPGDYVELTGAWTRGVFEAYRVAGIDTGAYRR
jgi:hypothetical protein